MNNSKTVSAYAKINLFLEVCDRLPDGYHSLESVMHSVSVYDTVTVRLNDSGEYSVNCPQLADIPCEKNLAVKAAMAFYEATDIPFGGVHIDIEKRIPMCAGLAGGSTDAAAVLKALNELHGDPFNVSQLCAVGSSVGADVPFCIYGKAALAKGIGEVLTAVTPLPDCFLVIAIGSDEGVSTRWAFERLDGEKNRKLNHPDGMLDALSGGDLNRIGKCLYNVFETVSPHSGSIKKIMLSHSPYGVLMSGSGPSIFGIFRNEDDARRAADEIINDGNIAFVCRPIS